MRLFKIEIERGKEGREIIVHADSEEDALAHVASRFKGWAVTQSLEIVGEAHFTVALLEP